MTSNFSLSALEEQHLIMKLFKTELISHYFILHYLYHSSFVLFWGRTKLRGKPDRLQVIKHASKASPVCHKLVCCSPPKRRNPFNTKPYHYFTPTLEIQENFSEKFSLIWLLCASRQVKTCKHATICSNAFSSHHTFWLFILILQKTNLIKAWKVKHTTEMHLIGLFTVFQLCIFYRGQVCKIQSSFIKLMRATRGLLKYCCRPHDRSKPSQIAPEAYAYCFLRGY